GSKCGGSLSDTGRVLHPQRQSGASEGVKGLAGWTHATGEAALSANVAEDQRASQKHDGRGPETVISVPLVARGRLIGVLRAGSARIGQFGGPELAALQAPGPRTAILVENGHPHTKTRAQSSPVAQ